MDPATELLFQIPRGLEQSILLAVLVGFLVTFVLAESFGWVFVGVVVPGYLASVLVIQPSAGVAVVLDSVLTYAVAKVLEQLLGRGGASSEFFGRERFFLLVVVSVFVRQHTQTWVWPLALEATGPWLDLPMSFQRGFSSIGIVLVPLMANLLWKLDLRRGTWQMLVTAGTTYVLLAWWLLPDTTLSYSALELSYEDTAIDFVGNAKAYIIFLCTAYVAAQLNLYYGWDFNGILVPALLGLLWFHPAKLAATFGEAIVVYLAAQRLPRAPGLRRITIEGPRKLALVFTSSVLLKWVMGWTLGDALPTLKITDLYGFGYLLPSLLVVKMTQRKSMRAVLLPTMVASLSGFVLGSVVGFGLSFWDPPLTLSRQNTRPLEPSGSTRLLASPEGVSALGHLHALARPDVRPDHARSVAYRRVWDAAARWVAAPDPLRHDALLQELEALELELVPVGELDGRPAYAMFERDTGPRRGWETALLVPGAQGPVIAVPRPVAEAPIAEAASVLCRRLHCRALLVAGADVERDPWLRLSTSSFDIARSAVLDQPLLVLRADPKIARAPVLHVGSKLPPSIDLHQGWAAELSLEWSAPPVESAGPLPPLGGTLRIHPHDVEALLRSGSSLVRHEATPPPWVMQREHDPVVHMTPPSPPPSAQEARYLELELVAPLVDVAAGRASVTELERLAWRATRLGLELWRISDCGDGMPCIGLVDPLGDRGLGWGSLLIRWGQVRAMGVEVPRPGRAFGTQQLGLELWHQLDARAIYIAPSTADERQDPLVVGNIHAPLLPFHQALDRSLGDGKTAPLLVQVLGFGVERTLDTDLVIGLGRPVLDKGHLPTKLQSVLDERTRGPLGWVKDPMLSDGSPMLHALSGLGSPAVEYSLELGNADVALLWFSPEVRSRFVRQTGSEEARSTLALGVDYGALSELSRMLPDEDHPHTAPPPDERLEELEELLSLASDYRRSHDIHALRLLLGRAKRGGAFEASVGQGTLTKRPMLVLEAEGPDWSLHALVLLDDGIDQRELLSVTDPELRQRIGNALLRRSAVVVVRSGPTQEVSLAP